MNFWIRYSFRSTLRRYKKTVVIFTGFTVSIAALVFLSALMTGVNDTMIQNALTLYSGYITVEGKQSDVKTASKRLRNADTAVKTIPGVVSTLPRLTVTAMIYNDNDTCPVVLNGIIPEKEQTITPVFKKMVAGDYNADSGLIIGKTLADKLKVSPGDTVSIVTPDMEQDLAISGIFRTGIEKFDSGVVFTRQSTFSTLENIEAGYHISVFLKNNDTLKEVTEAIRHRVTNEHLQHWEEKLPDIFQLIKLNQMAMGVMIILVIMILGFGIANTLLTSVMDRNRYFSIMKAMGLKTRHIVTTIVSEACIICLSSGVAGTAIGILITLITAHSGGVDLSEYTSHNPNFAVNSQIIPRITVFGTGFPQLLALSTGILASFIPALKISRQKVVKGMRGLM